MKSNEISHEGTIVSVNESNIQVCIIQNSACASCKIVGSCISSENKEKLIDVTVNKQHSYKVGDKVVVKESIGMSAYAVIYAFVIPLTVLLLATVLSLICFNCSEGIAVLIGMGSLIPYYIILYCMRSYMQKIMTFGIEKI